MSQDLNIYSNLAAQLATIKIRESIRKISTGKKTFFGGGGSTSSAYSLKAESAANYRAGLNLDDALAALRVTQISLDEIAGLNQRLAELGLLQSNNSLLSTEDTASLNKETASITTAIDNIVSNTKYNNIPTLGTSNITLSIGAGAYGSNPLTITIGGISSIASVTAASDATSTSNTLKTTLGTDQGQVNGASAAAKARRNTTSTIAAILKSAAENIESSDLAVETAKLTKNVLLNKVSLSLSAQANSINKSKLDLLG